MDTHFRKNTKKHSFVQLTTIMVMLMMECSQKKSLSNLCVSYKCGMHKGLSFSDP